MGPVEAAEQVADFLRGTACNTIESALEQHDLPAEYAEDEAFLNEIDQHVFVCEECGWWSGRDEESHREPEHCDECRPGESDDD